MISFDVSHISRQRRRAQGGIDVVGALLRLRAFVSGPLGEDG